MNWFLYGRRLGVLAALLAVCVTCNEVASAANVRAIPTADPNMLASELRRYAVPLETGVFSARDLKVEVIATATAGARVIGLGEGSHGTSEFYQIKDRIFRYLVGHRGFTVLAMEGDWSEWASIDRYIRTGDGTAAAVLRAQDFTMYRTSEMRDFIEWLRSYNASVASKDAVHVAGIDLQEPSKTFAIIADYVETDAPGVASTLAMARSCFRGKPGSGISVISKEEIATCDRALSTVQTAIDRSAAGASNDGYARQLAGQAISILRRSEPLLTHRGFAQRDRMMAQNVLWLAQDIYPNANIAVSAHDDHICTYDPHWQTTMGTELRKALGSQYYALGMTFGDGVVRAHAIAGGPFVPVPIKADPQNTAAQLFGTIDEPFFLDVDSVPPTSRLRDWLSQPQSLWMPGGVVWPRDVRHYALGTLTLARAFDGIVYVPTSHATNPL